jgi:MSHA biogenesis protein MshM
MYLDHFGLREAPFGLTPDTDYVFRGRPHQAAINTVLVALQSHEGFVKVTGEVGTGKTLLCRHLLASLPREVVSAYVLNPRLSAPELLRAIGRELSLELPAQADEHTLCRQLEAELMHLAAEGRRVVLCIDEAQALPVDSLEALRLLSNLETGKRKLIQIVLFGQPELDDTLRTHRIRSLASRIAFSACLSGLTRDDLADYLHHRLTVAGWRGPHVFGTAATWLLHHASGGVPRVANILAHKSLLMAYGHGVHRVGLRQAWAAVRDEGGYRLKPHRPARVG